MNFNVFLGCIKAASHIDAEKGIFGILEEKFTHLLRDNPIPARANTSCKCRKEGTCNQECRFAVYALQCGCNVSYRDPKKRM